MDFSSPDKAAHAFLQVLSSKDFESLSGLIHPRSTDPTAAGIRDNKVPREALETAVQMLGEFKKILTTEVVKDDPSRKGWVKVRYMTNVDGDEVKRRIYMALDVSVWRVMGL